MKSFTEAELQIAKRHGKLIGDLKPATPRESEKPEVELGDVLNAIVAVSRDVRASGNRDVSMSVIASLDVLSEQVRKLFNELRAEQARDRKSIEESISEQSKTQLAFLKDSKIGSQWEFTIEKDYLGQSKKVIAMKVK